MDAVLFWILILFCILGSSFLISYAFPLKRTKKFILKHNGFFRILFVFAFFIEQIILLYIIYIFSVHPKAQLYIGILALTVFTTATLQKFIWEYKYQHILKIVDRYSYVHSKELSNIKKEIDKIIKKKN